MEGLNLLDDVGAALQFVRVTDDAPRHPVARLSGDEERDDSPNAFVYPESI